MSDEKTAPEPTLPAATSADAAEGDEAWLPEGIGDAQAAGGETTVEEPAVEEPTAEPGEPAEEPTPEPGEPAEEPTPEQDELESQQDDAAGARTARSPRGPPPRGPPSRSPGRLPCTSRRASSSARGCDRTAGRATRS